MEKWKETFALLAVLLVLLFLTAILEIRTQERREAVLKACVGQAETKLELEKCFISTPGREGLNENDIVMWMLLFK
jgi:uncharacterized protein YpmS